MSDKDKVFEQVNKIMSTMFSLREETLTDRERQIVAFTRLRTLAVEFEQLARAGYESSLSPKVRKDLEEFVSDEVHSCMFGDGLEDDYVSDGVVIVGVCGMTDVELIQEALQHTGEEEEIIVQARAELAVNKMLETKEG
jgi:hypothetical protein